MILLAILGLKSPPGNCRNGLPNVHKPTQILKLRKGCVEEINRESYAKPVELPWLLSLPSIRYLKTSFESLGK